MDASSASLEDEGKPSPSSWTKLSGAPASGCSPSAGAELYVGACGVKYIISGVKPPSTSAGYATACRLPDPITATIASASKWPATAHHFNASESQISWNRLDYALLFGPHCPTLNSLIRGGFGCDLVEAKMGARGLFALRKPMRRHDVQSRLGVLRRHGRQPRYALQARHGA